MNEKQTLFLEILQWRLSSFWRSGLWWDSMKKQEIGNSFLFQTPQELISLINVHSAWSCSNQSSQLLQLCWLLICRVFCLQLRGFSRTAAACSSTFSAPTKLAASDAKITAWRRPPASPCGAIFCTSLSFLRVLKPWLVHLPSLPSPNHHHAH